MESQTSPDAAPDTDADAIADLEAVVDLAGLLRFDATGLVPAVVQDHASGDVLMVAWMNAEAVRATVAEGRTVFWSRSRRQLWRKGQTSGHVQHVRDLHVDCDADTLLVTVEQVGAACHAGEWTCFHRRPTDLVAPDDRPTDARTPSPNPAQDPA